MRHALLATVSRTVQALLLLALAGLASAAPLTGIVVHSTDSEQGPSWEAEAALDGNPATFWHTQYVGASPAHPHWIVLDLGTRTELEAFTYQARQDRPWNGTLGRYELAVSDDPQAFGPPIATGTFAQTRAVQTVPLPHPRGRYVKLTALSALDGAAFTSAAELGLQGVPAPQLTLTWDQAGAPDFFTLYRSVDSGETYEPHATVPGEQRTYDEWEIPADVSVCYVITNTHQGVESQPNRWPLCLDAAAPPSCLGEQP